MHYLLHLSCVCFERLRVFTVTLVHIITLKKKKSNLYQPLSADLDECASADDNNCDANANCTNTVGSFTCECHPGYVDSSSDYPGRNCVSKCLKISPMSSFQPKFPLFQAKKRQLDFIFLHKRGIYIWNSIKYVVQTWSKLKSKNLS